MVRLGILDTSESIPTTRSNRASPARIESENMDDSDSLRKELQAMRDRMTQLCEASLRINESLDLETVFRGSWIPPVR